MNALATPVWVALLLGTGPADDQPKKAPPPAEELQKFQGTWQVESWEEGGKGVAAADLKKRGAAYVVTYRLGEKVLFAGMAIRKGDQLSMSWVSAGQAGVSVYKIEAGPKLVGEYTILGGIGAIGKEVLTPWKKVD